MPRIPYREYWPIAALILFGVFIYTPVLFFGKAFYGEEQIGFYYALSHYAQESLQNGTSLLWNGAYYGGISSSLAQFVGAWYPINLFLFSTFGLFTAHHLSMFFATTLGLLFAYWFGRRQGWHPASALVLALGYFSATTFAWLQIGTTAAHSFMILPAILLSLLYAAQVRTWRAYLIAAVSGGVALGIGFLAGFMQIVFYAYVVAGLYALFLDYTGLEKTTNWYKRFPISILYVCITLIGLLVGLRQFFPSAYFIDLTIRTSSYAAQHAVYPYPTEFITFLLPPYLDIPFLGGGHAAGFYIGTLGIVFAVLGLLYYCTPALLFFAAVYALVLGFAFHLPVFGWLNEHVPPFSNMGGNFRWMTIAAFPLAYLGAAGVEGYLCRPGSIPLRAKRFTLYAVGAITAGLVFGSVFLSYVARTVLASEDRLATLLNWYTSGRTLVYEQEHYIGILTRTIGDLAAMFSLANLRFLFGVAMWVFALILVWLLWHNRSFQRYGAYVIAAFFCVNIAGAAALEWSMLVPQALYREKPALVSELTVRESNPHSYRILGFLLGDGMYAKVFSKLSLPPAEMTRVQHELLVNNANLYWGIERMDGMEPYRTLRHNRLLTTVLGYDAAAYVFDPQSPALQTSALDQLYNRDVQRVVSIDEKLEDFANKLPLLSMMNVKYVYSPYELRSLELQLLETIPLNIPGAEAQIYLYQNTRVLPRIYFATSPAFIAGSDTEVLLSVAETKDFSKQTWIECTDCEHGIASPQDTIEIARYENGHIELTTNTRFPRWLVFSESFMPGWVAEVDAEAVPIYPTNYLFQAIQIPSGEHRVSFIYKDVTMLKLGELVRQ